MSVELGPADKAGAPSARDAPETMVNPRGDGPGPPRVAVVLPGGGARGAYEAGALSVLLPKLEEHGQSVSI